MSKVAAYITCDEYLLVFSQPASPSAGVQIPSGTVEPTENLDEAVLREAEEETGLSDLRIKRFLGTRVYDMAPITGQEVDVHRHFYHLHFSGPIKERRWRHWEMSPSGSLTEPIEFELSWVKYPEQVPELSAEFADLLHEVVPDA